MIRPLILFLFMFVNVACVSYVDDFAYLPVLRAQEGGGEFDVRLGANAAQTIRKNFEWNPTFETVAHRSAALAARLSGCTVNWVIGDPSVQPARVLVCITTAASMWDTTERMLVRHRVTSGES